MARKDASSTTILWWIGWIVLTIVSFFVCSAVWTPWVARHVGPMTTTPAAPLIWVALVFGSWMVLLIPLIVLMYQKVDKAYEDARIAREKSTLEKQKALWGVRSVLLDPDKRRLADAIRRKISGIPEAIRQGHLVHLKLRDGRQVRFAFVLDQKELLGVYDLETVDFDARDIADIEAADLDKLPVFEPDRWLRLDGIGSNA